MNKLPELAISQYNSFASQPDANGLYTVVDFKRKDGTVYARSTLQNPNSAGRYQNAQLQYFDGTGNTVLKTEQWAFTYDAVGQIISKVVS